MASLAPLRWLLATCSACNSHKGWDEAVQGDQRPREWLVLMVAFMAACSALTCSGTRAARQAEGAAAASVTSKSHGPRLALEQAQGRDMGTAYPLFRKML